MEIKIVWEWYELKDCGQRGNLRNFGNLGHWPRIWICWSKSCHRTDRYVYIMEEHKIHIIQYKYNYIRTTDNCRIIISEAFLTVQSAVQLTLVTWKKQKSTLNRKWASDGFDMRKHQHSQFIFRKYIIIIYSNLLTGHCY